MMGGFMEGIFSVFPYNSSQANCSNNVTHFMMVYDKLFVKQLFTLPEDNIVIVNYMADLLRFPYGVTFSCYMAQDGIFTYKKKKSDEQMDRVKYVEDPEDPEQMILVPYYSQEELFENKLMVFNNILTNLLFNLGYMYSDVANYLWLETSNLHYWTRVGDTIGDFFIRFWFRESFIKTFEFERLDDCDRTKSDIVCPEGY